MKKLILIFLFLLLIPLINAQCLDVKIAKASYLAGETFQAEITGNLITPLNYNDIYFYYNGKEYFPPVLSLEQIAANKWIVYSDVLEKYGLNDFSVERVICRENNTLKEESKKLSFSITKPLQAYYNSLLSKLNGKWASLSSDEISQAVIALSDFPESEDGKIELQKKGTGECWPSSNCTVKSTSLALLALGNSTEARNWLLDSQNSVSSGLWKLITNADSEKICSLIINENAENVSIPAGINEISLNLPDTETINVSLNCDANAKISHTYLGKVHEFPLGIINNKKCWGKYYKTECDALSTAYALQIISDSNAAEWLSENAKSTEEIAYAYIYTKNSDFESFLVNNQHLSGYWGNSSLAISNVSDIFSTVAAIKALNGNSKAESWLRENLDYFSLEQQSIALQIFKDKIEPIVSIQQAVIKTSSLENFTLKFSNKGVFPVKISTIWFSSAQTAIIPPKTAISLTFSVPKVQSLEFSSLDAAYKLKEIERSYSIPSIIFPTKEQSIIINEIISQGTLKTADFQFIETGINETIGVNELKEKTINIRNIGADTITVDLTVWGLSDVIQQIPSSVEIKPGETSPIIIKFQSPNSFEYSGQITAETKGNSVSIPVYINVKQPVSEKSCSELNGKICDFGYVCKGNSTTTPQGSCCVGECSKTAEAKPISLKTIGIIMVIVAVLIAALFIFLKLRKPKRPALEKVLAKIKEESKMREPEEKV